MIFEYKQVYAYIDGDGNGYSFTVNADSSLDQLGAEGWELISTVNIAPKGRLEGVVFIMKKAVK